MFISIVASLLAGSYIDISHTRHFNSSLRSETLSHLFLILLSCLAPMKARTRERITSVITTPPSGGSVSNGRELEPPLCFDSSSLETSSS